jgi:phosphinothricin acetyltransferase
METMPEIRDAREADLPAILAIYNDVVATSTAIYRDDPATLEDRRSWFAARQQEGQPVLVAVDGETVIGFAAFGGFRPWPGYRFTVEHSVHVRADRRGQGVGGALMGPLIARATALGMHVMIAGVDAGNEPSIRFHERFGFRKVAHLPEVGFKFGRWLDLVLMQRRLSEGVPPLASGDFSSRQAR